MISNYFSQIEGLLASFPYIVSIESSFETVDIDRGYFRVKLVLANGSELYLFEFVEIINNKPVVSKYRYHWQAKDSKIILRWDNAPHHKEIETFPHHLHEGEDRVKPSEKPDLSFVLLKISDIIEKGKYGN